MKIKRKAKTVADADASATDSADKAESSKNADEA